MKDKLNQIKNSLRQEYYRLFNEMDDLTEKGYDAEARARSYKAQGLNYAIRMINAEIEKLV